MKTNTPDTRKKELAQIHMGIAALQWTDADYRAILHTVTGKSSAGDLDATQRKRFIDHLKKCGWQTTKKPVPAGGWQAHKIEQLWAQLGAANALNDPTAKGLKTFVQNQTRAASHRFLSTRDSIKVIEALKAWLKRVKAAHD
jgi:phage gp16-like protein